MGSPNQPLHSCNACYHAGASEAEPVVVGKPSPLLLDVICRQGGISKEQVCVVGDRLDTDVLWAERNGCGSLLVLTGGCMPHCAWLKGDTR